MSGAEPQDEGGAAAFGSLAKNTGVGLALVAHLAERVGGRLIFEPEGERKLTAVYLPRAWTEEPTVGP